ncbi:alpha/beta hydrolase [Ammoniphilus sp. YIM 78166]|uniref:alpha/beta hydrolase n=1 Tax=Ammoniphilus sp. YIM 78166 TaxID=1644106 RepID=UPI001F10D878|nr:alpha/beta hydrolase [Ammoniphilus sp. YIM 78166]
MYVNPSQHPVPDLQSYITRDGSKLYYRFYENSVPTPTAIILLHGISEDSKYLYTFSKQVSTSGLAHVFTPDLRGYGAKAVRLGDIHYIGQLEDDLADLVQHIKTELPHVTRMVMAGHSAGGGTAIRFASSRYADSIDSYLLLAPHLGAGNPTERPADEHRKLHLGRVILLSFLHAFGIKRWHGLPALEVTKHPEELHDGIVTSLSYRLLFSRSPLSYKRALAKLTKPTLVLVGEEDEVFYADRYANVLSSYPNTQLHLVPGCNHDGILTDPDTLLHFSNWLKTKE